MNMYPLGAMNIEQNLIINYQTVNGEFLFFLFVTMILIHCTVAEIQPLAEA